MSQPDRIKNILVTANTPVTGASKDFAAPVMEQAADMKREYAALFKDAVGMEFKFPYGDKRRQKWQRTVAKMSDLDLLRYQVSDSQFKENASGQGTALSSSLWYAYEIGAMIGIQTQLKGLEELAAGGNFTTDLQPYKEMVEFSASRHVTTPFAGITAFDFLQKPIPNLGSRARFLLEAFDCGLNEDPAAEQNYLPSLPLYQKYPDLGAQTLHVAAIALINFHNILHYTINPRKLPPRDAEAAQWSNQLADAFLQTRHEMIVAIENPSHPSAESLRQALSPKLDAGEYQRLLSLFIMTWAKVPATKVIFHSVGSFRDGESSAFYQGLGQGIEDLRTNTSTLENLADINDLQPLIIAPTDQPPSVVDVKDFTGEISKLVRRGNKSLYQFDHGEIPLTHLTAPNQISVKLDPVRPTTHFAVTFNYQSEFGEKLTFSLVVDTKTSKSGWNVVDWNVLDDIESPQAAPFKQAISAAALEVLTTINAQAEQKTSQPQPVVAKDDQPTTKPEYVPDAWRKQFNDDQTAEDNSGSGSLMSAIQEAKRKGAQLIKREIVFPDQEQYERWLSQITSYDRPNITSGITDFNERGVGQFTRKKGKREGEIVYTLRVNTRVPGDARVLAREQGSEKGHRRFEILDIRYRKEIYEKNDL